MLALKSAERAGSLNLGFIASVKIYNPYAQVQNSAYLRVS